MPDEIPETPSPDYGPIESIAEDVVGFNFRSFRTIGTLFADPHRLFATYTRRRQGIYTPALRLWLGLSVILAVLTFFFGGHAEMMERIIGNWPETQRNSLIEQAGGDLTRLTDAYASAFSLLQPILIATLMIPMVFLTVFFRRRLSWVARINIVFAVAVAGSLVGLATFPFLVQRPDLGMVALAPIWLAYWITMFRGSRGIFARTMTGRVVKATLYSVLMLILVFIAGLLSVGLSLAHAISSVQIAA